MNKMIGLWAHPRSRSTILERVFIERNDFEVFHEPFAHMAFSSASSIPSDDWDNSIPSTYEEIKEMLLSAKKQRNVFHKDMCYHCKDDLKTDEKFLSEQTNIFLIREPVRSILSHYAVFPDMPLESIGHKAMYEIFCVVTKLTGKIPYVINADVLAREPEIVVRKLCDYIGIDFIPESMGWKKGCPEQWKTWRNWHKSAEESEHIRADKQPEIDMEVFNQNPKLKKLYEYHRPFYERMNAFCE